MAYGNFKDLTKRTTSDKILQNKAFDFAKDPKYDGYQRGLSSMAYKCSDKKKLLAVVLKIRIFLIMNWRKNYIKQLLENLKKKRTIIKKKYKKAQSFLLCFIDISSQYALVIPLKDEKGIAITNAFQKILKQSNCKPNKIWVDKGSKKVIQ